MPGFTNFFKDAKVKVPNKSGHDLSVHKTGTAHCGTLIPIVCKEMIPGSKFNVRAALSAELAPLAVDSYMKAKVKFEAFFVPFRLLYKGFPEWFTSEKINVEYYSSGDVVTSQYYSALPRWDMPLTDWSANGNQYLYQALGPGSLADYLGYKFTKTKLNYLVNNQSTITPNIKIQPWKFIAYGLVYDTWYRNTKVQRSLFSRRNHNNDTYFTPAVYPDTVTYNSASPYVVTPISVLPWTVQNNRCCYADGSSVFHLRQRNFGLDYFTSAMLSAQQGSPQSISFDTSGSSGSFTIASLRAANSLQQWLERSSLSGYRWQDWLSAHYGSQLRSGVAQRPIFLGREELIVETKGIEQTAQGVASQDQRNFFEEYPGATWGKAYATGNGSLAEHVEVEEPGYLMVMMSLVPRQTYSSGVLRENMHFLENGSVTDFADPLLQNTGNQPIYSDELSYGEVTPGSSVFAFNDHYSEYFSSIDELHGELRDESSLAAYALQRNLDTCTGVPPVLSDSFLQIPKTYLDQCFVTSSKVSHFSYWFDVAFNLPVSHPMAEYSIPSLQDPSYEHGKEITVSRGGSSLN